jgi:hypothetical protein
MKDEILKYLQVSSNNLSTESIIIAFVAAVIISAVIFVSYRFSHSSAVYSAKFNVSLVMITIVTTLIMCVIGNNVALSLGMVGALSIVRFRTAIKDSRDTVYIFWAIIVGICCGVGDFVVASIGSVVTFAVLWIFSRIKNDKRMLLIIRADRDKLSALQSVVFEVFNRKAIMRVQNTTKTTVELIYELSDDILKKAELGKHGVSEQLYAVGGVEYVNIVMQNDEISG